MQSGSLDEMAAVQAAKVEVAELHAELPRNGLVSWTTSLLVLPEQTSL
jgi:hypothetical protein